MLRLAFTLSLSFQSCPQPCSLRLFIPIKRVPKNTRFLIKKAQDPFKITDIAIKMRITTFFSETIKTIVNWLFHTAKTRQVLYHQVQGKQEGLHEKHRFWICNSQEERPDLCRKLERERTWQKEIVLFFLQLGYNNSACVLTAVLFLHYPPNKQLKLTC